MCEQDGVDYLLRAIKYYSKNFPQDTQFVLIGGGPDQNRMKILADEMDLNGLVKFTGRIPDEELWDYLSNADICLDPDPWTEWSDKSTMNKIIEYMAFGCPIVAFDLKEHRHSALDAASYIQDNDEEAFAKEIRALLEDPTKRKEMSNFGKNRFKNELAWENSEQHLLAAYHHLLSDSK